MKRNQQVGQPPPLLLRHRLHNFPPFFRYLGANAVRIGEKQLRVQPVIRDVVDENVLALGLQQRGDLQHA